MVHRGRGGSGAYELLNLDVYDLLGLWLTSFLMEDEAYEQSTPCYSRGWARGADVLEHDETLPCRHIVVT